ncbi:MAG: DUF3667 domain-containing protein [Burkholderiales bacterium]
MWRDGERAGEASTRVAADSPAAAPVDACRNCGAHATGHFCPNCGQETRIALPTFPAFMREAAGRYVALDGRLWRTLAALVARPGFLTLEYFAGRRKRYIRPARLFLVLWLLLFAVIGIVQSPIDLKDSVVQIDADAEAEAPAPAGSPLAKDAAKAPAKAAAKGASGAVSQEADAPTLPRMAIVDTEDGNTLFGLDKDLNLALRWNGTDVPLPPQLARRWDHFRKLSKDGKAEQIYAGLLRYGPYAVVALLPAFALLLKLAYLGRGRSYPGRPQRYAEHLVYAAHLHAFAAIALLVLVLVPFGPARFALALWIVFYVMRARQAVYRGRWWAGVARAFLIAMVYTVLMGLATAALLVAAVMLR